MAQHLVVGALAVLAAAVVMGPRYSLQGMARELIQAVSKTHPDILYAVVAVKELPVDQMRGASGLTVRRGKYDRQAKVVYVSTLALNGNPLPRPVVAGTLVHELAHAVSTATHSDEWRSTFEHFLRVATTHLKWDITLECSACPLYNMCRQEQCPACHWKRCTATVKSTE